MAGKIDHSSLLSNVEHTKNETVEQRDACIQKKGKIQRVSAEHVDISIRKGEVEKLKKLATEIPDSRSDKIVSLKQQVNRGTYHVDADVVAEKMLANQRWT